MLKQRYLTHFVLVIALLSVITSCRNASNTSGATTSDTVQFHSIVIRDSIFDSKKSSIIVDANISLPDANKQLFRLFTKELLGINGDSIDANQAVKSYVNNILDFYKSPGDTIESDLEDETEKVSRYEICHRLVPIYNAAGIVSIKKTTSLTKNGTSTMNTNAYITFDVYKMTRIGIDDIINEEYTSDVEDLLKEQLMKQEDVTNQSQLFDMGYFNIDNLSASNNFYITNKSIVFAYQPYEIACLQVGEVCIPLTFKQLDPYKKDNDFTAKLFD